MQIAVFFEFIHRYWNHVHAEQKHLLSVWLESEQKQGREQMQFVADTFIYLFIYIWLQSSVCLCKR